MGGGLKSTELRTTVASMDRPIEVELPHRLGKEEARRRIAGNIHKLQDHIPGGASHVDSNWTGDDLNLNMSAIGQTIAAQIGVEEKRVVVRVMLPPMLAMFARPIEAALSAKGGDMLLEDRRKD